MRKMLILLLCAVMLIPLVGCNAEEAAHESERGYDLYFIESDLDAVGGEGALTTERTILPADTDPTDRQQIAEMLLNRLLEGPLNPGLKSAVPAGTTLQSLKLQGTQAIVDLSVTYQSLSGIALTLADYAVVMTLTQLPSIMSVKITVRGRELAYRDKQVLMDKDVLLAPEGDILGTVTVELYFQTEQGVLRGEERTLELYEGDTQVAAVIQAIEQGPQNKNLRSVWPEGFRVRGVWQEDGVCYVNLSSVVRSNLSEDARLDITLQALSESLGSLESVEEVRFLVDGEFSQYYGPVDISQARVA